MNAGYRVSLSHANKTSLKTNAPAQVLWVSLYCGAYNGNYFTER